MAEDLLTPHAQFGKTFSIAMWVLGGVSMAQLLAVGVAVLRRPDAFPAPKPPMGAAESFAERGTAAIAAPGDPRSQSAAAASRWEPSENPSPASIRAEGYDPFAGSSSPLPAASGAITAPAVTDATEPQAPLRSALPPLPGLKNGGLTPAAAASMSAVSAVPPPDYQAPTTPPLPSAHLNEMLLPSPQFGDPGGGGEPLASALSQASLTPHQAHHIDDPILRGLVTSGAELRGAGNMQGSLQSLRQAEAALPDHPRILSEIAATYSEMGLTRKAVLYWEKVQALGAEKGGAYYDLAGMEMRGQRLRGATVRTVLRIGSVEAIRDQAPVAGERVLLKVTIQAEPGAHPNPGDMAMLVYFFDLVNGEKWEASTADTSQNFITAPYDWQEGGQEIIEVVYHQPVFSETQKRELGERTYYGYVIELYYRDELQGTVAEPSALKSIDDPIPDGNPGLFGPENSLFPDPSPPE